MKNASKTKVAAMGLRHNFSRAILFVGLASIALTLAACGLFGSSTEGSTTSTEGERAIVPTWTSTPQGAAPEPTATVAFESIPAAVQPAPVDPNAAPAASTSVFSDLTPAAVAVAPVTNTVATSDTAPVTTTAPATATAASVAKASLTVTQDGINVRTGPGTNYGIGGNVSTGAVFDIIAKNAAGDWWQVCCVAGEPVWVFAQLATVANAESVPVAANIPEPVAAAPAPTAAPAAPAAPAPEPTAEPAPAAPPADDPCAGIGGDGCKFRMTGGPAFAGNGGGELKLTLGFIHSGIDGGQPQGSYFVVVLKDGENIGVPDSVRSFDPSVGFRDGPNGRYNYEWKIGASDLPGGNIQGNYQIWVLDGNGERDSQTFSFSVPEGQGEVWITFDQA